jgi:chorismate mutase-like protein
VLALIFTVLTGCVGQPTFDAAERLKVDELLLAIKSHLALAGQVARDSWLARRPVEDPRAEAEFVDSAVNGASAYALPPEMVQEFFRAQIDAAKQVQNALQAQWRADPNTSPTASGVTAGATKVRVAPSSAPLLAALAHAYPMLGRDGSRTLLEQRANELLAGVPGGPNTATTAITPLWRMAQ